MPIPCPQCHGRLAACPRCGGSVGSALTGPAAARGRRWAEQVVGKLVRRWTAWPLRGAKALALATRRVEDLHRYTDDVRTYLVRICLEAAHRRYQELKEFLEGKRANMVRRDRTRPQ